MITDATETAGTGTATETTPATSAPAVQEPSQEAILSELQASEKQGRPASIGGLGGKPEPAEPAAQAKTEYQHEKDLQKKFGESYIAKQERQAKKASEYRAKIDALGKQISELEAKWKSPERWKDGRPAPESQLEYVEDSIEYKNLKRGIEEKTAEYDEKVAEYREGIKAELIELYSGDATFRAQHDHYSDMVFRDMDGAREFSAAIMGSPDRILLLQSLYGWLDNSANFNAFKLATAEQRMAAVGMQLGNLRFKPRSVATASAPAPAANAPAAQPQVKAPSINPDPAGLGGGGGLELSKQEDALKYLLQREKETGRRLA
jgi:hypothetical protein